MYIFISHLESQAMQLPNVILRINYIMTTLYFLDDTIYEYIAWHIVAMDMIHMKKYDSSVVMT